MARDEGFPNADIDVHLFADNRLRKLERVAGSEEQYACCVVLWLATLLGSWADGRRLCIDDVVPPVEPTPERLALLRQVGLFDESYSIAERAFSSWYGTAQGRRAERQRTGAIGGLIRSLGLTLEQATAEYERRQQAKTLAQPSPASAQANPTVLPSVRPPDRAGPDGQAAPAAAPDGAGAPDFTQAMRDAGLREDLLP